MHNAICRVACVFLCVVFARNKRPVKSIPRILPPMLGVPFSPWEKKKWPHKFYPDLRGLTKTVFLLKGRPRLKMVWNLQVNYCVGSCLFVGWSVKIYMPTNASINPYKSLFLQSKGSPCFHVVTIVLIAILAGEFSPRGWTSSIYWLVDIPMSFLGWQYQAEGNTPSTEWDWNICLRRGYKQSGTYTYSNTWDTL